MFDIKIEGIPELKNALERATKIEAATDAVLLKTGTQMLNEIRGSATPKKSGELRTSASMSRGSHEVEVGYTKEYAPHVEYGHRIVMFGKNRGFVNGQRFLQSVYRGYEKSFQAEIERAVKELI